MLAVRNGSSTSIVATGNGTRGAIFALYTLAETVLGVDPWWRVTDHAPAYAAGGSVSLRSGAGDASSSGDVSIGSADGSTSGGVSLSSGTATGGSSGDVSLSSGASSADVAGSVELSVGASAAGAGSSAALGDRSTTVRMHELFECTNRNV